MQHNLGDGCSVHIDDPVVVSWAEPGENRWGRHQFVRLSRYPEEKILLRFHAGADSVTAYGSAEPAYLSDDGTNWTPISEDDFSKAGFSFPVQDGEYLCIPPSVPLNLKDADLSLPSPDGAFFSYRTINLYRADRCAAPIQDYLNTRPCQRWSPHTGQWKNESLKWDNRDRLVWVAQGEEAGLISGSWTEHSPVQKDGVLLYADYRASYLTHDGGVPGGCGVVCMVSADNGRSWLRRSNIVDPDAVQGEISNMTEPVLTLDVHGNPVCVIRRADQTQKSMLITRSDDDGHTWEKPKVLDELGDFGVFPDLATLDSGVMVLSYGRPGVHLTFSMDGTGRSWTPPITILTGDKDHLSAKTDGYTGLLPVGPDEFLLAYTDFEVEDEQGRPRKSVLTRRVRINRQADRTG